MFENNELARALTELPDELLLEEAQVTHRKKPLNFRRLIAVAAVIALLAVTVCAATMGITWNVGKEIHESSDFAMEYYKDNDGALDFEKLEYTVPLGVKQLPDWNMTEIRNRLRFHWDLTRLEEYAQAYAAAPESSFFYDSYDVDEFMEDFISRYSISKQRISSFETLEDVERLLGIDLDVPDALREAIRTESEKGYERVLSVRINTAATVAQVTEALGTAEPTEIVINYQLGHYCMNGQASGVIVIPLTEEEAQNGMDGLSYSYVEKEGAIWQDEQTIGGRDVTFFGNDPEEGYDGWSEAVFVQDGIGYMIDARWKHDVPYYSDNWFYCDSAKELLLSLFADTE